jgi:CheY-like chemotaxis protein
MSKKILIVDDEETSRRILTIALEGRDHVLVYAKDGEEAVAVAVREQPDLIVMDIDLPKMNGYDAARRIKDTPGLRRTKIAAVTARTVQYSEEMARQAGCDDFITKPYRLAAIRERLSRLLGA